MTVIAVYGQFHDNWSNAYVSRGIVAGLDSLGFEMFCVGDEEPEGMWGYQLGNSAVTPAAAAPLVPAYGMPITDWPAIHVGYPVLASDAFWAHRIKIGFFIAESAVIPFEWGQIAARCDLVCVPSYWTYHAYRTAGVPESKLLVVHHGIHPHFKPFERTGDEYKNKLLHVAGARDFIERKGTPVLLQAWEQFAKGHPRWKLTIRTPASETMRQLVEDFGVNVEMDYHDVALPPEKMHEYYQGFAGVIQPSRGEAFGLVPVEARACGLSAILGNVAGHVEHVDHGDVCIQADPANLVRQAVNGIPNGYVVFVGIVETVKALELFARERGRLDDDAYDRARNGYAERWLWYRVLHRRQLMYVLRAGA